MSWVDTTVVDGERMRVLVTGGAGFIGSNLVDRLLSSGHQVTVLDNFSNGRWSNLTDASAIATSTPGAGLHIVELDVRDPALETALEAAEPEVIYHLAGQISVRTSVADPVLDADVNVVGTVALACAAQRAGVRKIVFASSGGSIYGPSAKLPTGEGAPMDPVTPYAVSKVAGELYLNAFSRMHGLQCTHLAFANVYGPRQDPAGEAGVVAIFSQSLLGGRPTAVFGDGTNSRDYVYVSDVVDALELAGGAAADRTRLNIGTGVQTTDRRLHTLIAQLAEAPDHPACAPARHGDVPHSALDSSLAAATLGWYPRHDLATGLAKTVEHFARADRTDNARGVS